MALPTYNERSGVEHEAEFTDVNGSPALPDTVHHRFLCDTNDRTLRDWTAVTPTVVTVNGIATRVYVTIEIPGSLTSILDRSNQRETKVLLIVANKDTDREYSEEYPFYVRRTKRN